MVDPTASLSSCSQQATPTHHEVGGTLIPSTDEGCNDDPPPIPLPPADPRRGVSAGGVTTSDSSRNPSNLNSPGSSIAFVTKIRDYAGETEVNEIPSPTVGSFATSVISSQSTQSSATAVDPPRNDVDIEASSQNYAGQSPHAADAGTVAETLGVLVDKGLTTEEAQKRLHDEGANRLTTDGGVRWYTILGRQVANSLTLVRLCDLLFAAFWCDASVLCLFEELSVRCTYCHPRRRN